MKKIMIYFGSSTGTTEAVAKNIAQRLHIDENHIKDVSTINAEAISNAEVLLLGSSTWGDGEMQDDWYDGIKILKSVDLKGKLIGLFGCGDSQSYPDSFCGAMGEIYNELKESDAEFIGSVPTEDYDYSDSSAVIDGKFIGLPLDETNEDDKTDGRIEQWLEGIKSYLE